MQSLSSVDRPTTLPVVESLPQAPATSGVTAQEEPQQSGNQAQQQGQRLAVLGRWALAADLSKRLALGAQTEQTIRTLYQNLEQMKQFAATQAQFAKSTDSIQSLLQQSQAVQAAPYSGLEESLALSSYAASSYRATLPAQLDFISPKNLPEEVAILLGRSGKAVTLQLPANHSKEQNLAHIQQQFALLGISVTEGAQGQLEFATALVKQGLLKEHWQLSGQGVRVAAGNAIQVKLTKAEPPLQQLMPDKQQQLSQYLKGIEQAQQKLKESLAKLRHSQAELKAQLQQLQWTQQAADTEQLKQRAQTLFQTDSLAKTQLIMAQTGINRSFVSFGLG